MGSSFTEPLTRVMHHDEKKKGRISLQIFAKAETLESQLPTNTPLQEELDLLIFFPGPL